MRCRRPKGVGLVGRELLIRVLTPVVGEVLHLLHQGLRLLMHVGLKIEAIVYRLSHVPSVGPTALSRAPREEHLLLLSSFKALKFLDNQNGATMPDVLHYGLCLLEYSLLEREEVIDVKRS